MGGCRSNRFALNKQSFSVVEEEPITIDLPLAKIQQVSTGAANINVEAQK
jgi:hypothetical protein